MFGATALQGDQLITSHLSTDYRSSWFEQDDDARFVLDRMGEVLDCNRAARAMIRQGHLRIDQKGHIQLPRRVAPGVAETLTLAARSLPDRRLFQLQMNTWLTVVLSRNNDAVDGSMFLVARQVTLGREIDLKKLAYELGISDSERAVMEGVVQAICPKEISRTLSLSIHTIRAHIRSIYAKLGVKTAAEAQFKVLQVYLLTSSVK